MPESKPENIGLSPFITHQENDSYCGPAVIETALQRLTGKKISQQEIATYANTTIEEGTTPNGLIHAAEKVGLHAQINHFSLDELKTSLQPNTVIVVNFMAGEEVYSDENIGEPYEEMNDGHWAILDSINQKEIIISDPFSGKQISVPPELFEKYWWDLIEEKNGIMQGASNMALVITKHD